MQQRDPREPRVQKFARNAERFDIEMQERGDQTERLLQATLDHDLGGADAGAG